jgi:dipeptidyl aminopeptidase/acylaminoacyl peptidase
MTQALVWGLAAGVLFAAEDLPLPENLVADQVPPIAAALRADAGRYLEFRAAAFNGWHPVRRELLVVTRFAETPQLHQVRQPGGARRQLTFTDEPVAGAAYRPKVGDALVFLQDTGGGEFFQLHRHDVGTGRNTLLTDGRSRHGSPRWSRDGRSLAFTSTRRNGKDTDIWVMNPDQPGSERQVLAVNGGGFSIPDWSHDGTTLLLQESISINESRLHLLDLKTGQTRLLTPGGEKAAYSGGQFSRDDRTIYTATDRGSEYQRLVRLDRRTGAETVLTAGLRWDVSEFEVSPDGRLVAFVTNEDGAGVLHLMDTRSGRPVKIPALPLGVPSGLRWHENGRDLGFSFTSARSPADAWSLDVKSGHLTRWTESETGGLDTSGFVEPEIVRLKSFDGLGVSAFVYRPDPARFPGPRPVLVVIHGGPESQSRPVFLARNNYYLNELGVALVYPNVRGSSGYGKTFLTLDNGFKREDSVRDIGTVLDWIQGDARLDRARVGVMGGSYGGYMVLASLVHFGERLRCAVDIVGISNFLTFLKNTQDYRRDLRRVEYGDEREPQMAEFLARISPMAHAARIRRPLFVVQGRNDPRVPVTEAEQMVKAIRDQGGLAWYLMARDEGHGFAKKKNADHQFLSTIRFLQEHLLK